MNHVKIEPFKIIGISIRTTNENGQAAKEIADLWGKFINEKKLDVIPNKIDDVIYSIYTDYEDHHTKPYTAILACRVKNLDAISGMIGKSFNGGSYVKLVAKGDLTKGLIINKWSEIWQMELDRAFTVDFEVFGKKAQNPFDAEIDFYVAVKK